MRLKNLQLSMFTSAAPSSACHVASDQSDLCIDTWQPLSLGFEMSLGQMLGKSMMFNCKQRLLLVLVVVVVLLLLLLLLLLVLVVVVVVVLLLLLLLLVVVVLLLLLLLLVVVVLLLLLLLLVVVVVVVLPEVGQMGVAYSKLSQLVLGTRVGAFRKSSRSVDW
jgi:hypothetical protein